MAIKIKSGVEISHISFALPRVMLIVYYAQLLSPEGYEVTITSGCEGKHSPRSKHHIGKALDLRIRDLPEGFAKTWARRLQRRLGDEYFVLLEETHLHMQWNG